MTHVSRMHVGHGVRRKHHASDHADASDFGGSDLPCVGLLYCAGITCSVGNPQHASGSHKQHEGAIQC